MRWISLGNACIPQLHFRHARGVRDPKKQSPFGFVGTRRYQHGILDCIEDNCEKLLDKDQYIRVGPNKKWLHQGYNWTFSHHKNVVGNKEYEILKAQCNFFLESLKESENVAYIMSSFGWPFSISQPVLTKLREIIPEKCKLLFCRVGSLNEEVRLINGIYVADLLIESTQLKNNDRWNMRDGISVRYSKSKELKDIVDQVFLA